MRTPSRTLPSPWRCILALVLGALLGGRGRRWLYGGLLGYKIGRTATLGISFIRVAHLVMAPGSSIGHFTVIRNLHSLRLEAGSSIGTFNWIFGMIGADHFADKADRVSELVMEEESALTSRHIVDCTDRVVVGAFSTIAGYHSQILTHGIDVGDNRQRSNPVVVGRHCLIGTGVILVKGAVVPDGSVVGAGSVFRGRPGKTHYLYSGVPAEPVQPLSPESAYFTRTRGAVT